MGAAERVKDGAPGKGRCTPSPREEKRPQLSRQSQRIPSPPGSTSTRQQPLPSELATLPDCDHDHDHEASGRDQVPKPTIIHLCPHQLLIKCPFPETKTINKSGIKDNSHNPKTEVHSHLPWVVLQSRPPTKSFLQCNEKTFRVKRVLPWELPSDPVVRTRRSLSWPGFKPWTGN